MRSIFRYVSAITGCSAVISIYGRCEGDVTTKCRYICVCVCVCVCVLLYMFWIINIDKQCLALKLCSDSTTYIGKYYPKAEMFLAPESIKQEVNLVPCSSCGHTGKVPELLIRSLGKVLAWNALISRWRSSIDARCWQVWNLTKRQENSAKRASTSFKSRCRVASWILTPERSPTDR